MKEVTIQYLKTSVAREIKRFAAWVVVVLGMGLVVWVEVHWLQAGNCDWSYFPDVGKVGDEGKVPDRGALARDMVAYVVLWGGLGIAPQVRMVCEWMEARFVDVMHRLKTTAKSWHDHYGPEIAEMVQNMVQRFSAAAAWVSCFMLYYLVLLTLFPGRCVTMEERLVVLLLPGWPLGELYVRYQRTRSEVKKINDAAKMSEEVARQSRSAEEADALAKTRSKKRGRRRWF